MHLTCEAGYLSCASDTLRPLRDVDENPEFTRNSTGDDRNGMG